MRMRDRLSDGGEGEGGRTLRLGGGVDARSVSPRPVRQHSSNLL